ncbi:unnamed protein product [Litomosoides sigmodontis]|uniref:PHD-type domain-containing protein n=1 Tax=Litomosoides sigmodontis TaxID=42156 RepID=A0A3P6SPS5_LITSI|nr:unnamed protein product [Litomosoides sigmodontis]
MFCENKDKYFRGSGFTSGQELAEVAIRSADVQQPTGRRSWVDSEKKDCAERCFGPYDADAFGPAEKVFRATVKEGNSESHVQSMTPKDWGQSASMDMSSTLLSGERRQEKECLKRDVEGGLKKKPEQVSEEAGSDSVKTKLGKEKESFKRMCDSVLPCDKDKLFVKERSSGKLKCKEPEEEKRKDRYHNLEKTKENGREKASYHMQKALEKDKDQTKRDEKGLAVADERKEAQQERQREKGSGGEKKKGSDESEKGKGKKAVMSSGIRSEDLSSSYTAENDKKHREKGGNAAGSEERRKWKSVDKNEERGKGVEKDTKKYSKETRCSSEVKEKTKHHGKITDVEGKVKSRDKDYFKDNEKRKRHASDWDREHNTTKSSKGVEKVPSGEDEAFRTSSDLKAKNSAKDKLTENSRNSSSVPCDAVQKTIRDVFAKEQLSNRRSVDSDIFGSRSSTTDSLVKSSDKKSSTLDSDDSLDTMWICPECSVAYVEGATDMVGCDACDNWFHWNCVGLLVAPPDDAPWYCQNCAKKKFKKKSVAKSSTSKKGKK